MPKESKHFTREAINQRDIAAVTMRSVAAALTGEFLDVWDFGPWQQRAMGLISLGGTKITSTALGRMTASNGVEATLAKRVTASVLANWALSLYDATEGPWDALIIGAPNGGVAHLAIAMGIPFLSQHFTLDVQGAADPDDVTAHQRQGTEVARAILDRNADLAVIGHYDPLHRRQAVQHVNRLRCKLLDLPRPYQAYIHQNLRPGGTLIFVNCRYAWPMYFIDERHWFQVGGLGDVAAWDYIQARHPQIARLQVSGASAGDDASGHWGLPGLKAFEMPEAEWGTQPPLHSRVAQFARENGYEFVALEGAHPEHYAYLAFKVWQRLLRHADIMPQGVLLETYTQVAPTAVRQAALLPLWLPSNCASSLDFLRRVSRDLRQDPALRHKPVLWLPHPTGAENFDVASWQDWLDALEPFTVLPIGMQPERYPVDLRALTAAREEILAWTEARASSPEHAPVTAHAPLAWVLEEARALRRQRS